MNKTQYIIYCDGCQLKRKWDDFSKTTRNQIASIIHQKHSSYKQLILCKSCNMKYLVRNNKVIMRNKQLFLKTNKRHQKMSVEQRIKLSMLIKSIKQVNSKTD